MAFTVSKNFIKILLKIVAALEKKEMLKQKKVEAEKQKKSQESLKAYEEWCEKSKGVPRPATQGLLRKLFFRGIVIYFFFVLSIL